jgi:hypothetical protein
MEQPEETQELAEEVVAEEEVGVAEEEEEEEEVPPPPPPPLPRKRAPRREKPRAEATPRAVPVVDAAFWSSMLQTKREMDRDTRASQWANLVKF